MADLCTKLPNNHFERTAASALRLLAIPASLCSSAAAQMGRPRRSRTTVRVPTNSSMNVCSDDDRTAGQGRQRKFGEWPLTEVGNDESRIPECLRSSGTSLLVRRLMLGTQFETPSPKYGVLRA
jgi:hypothetical protein